MKKKIRHNFNKGIKLHLACANNLIRPVMNCIYFKDGYAIASNGMILIKACLNEICNFIKVPGDWLVECRCINEHTRGISDIAKI